MKKKKRRSLVTDRRTQKGVGRGAQVGRMVRKTTADIGRKHGISNAMTKRKGTANKRKKLAGIITKMRKEQRK